MSRPTSTRVLPQHTESAFNYNEPLYGKFRSATGTAISTLPLLREEFAAAPQLKEISALCARSAEAAKRLMGVVWEALQDGDVDERRKMWELASKFTNLVVRMAEMVRATTKEYEFQKSSLAAVGKVVRFTKELYVFMNGPAFRHMAQPPSRGRC